jgi:hypothetical protein
METTNLNLTAMPKIIEEIFTLKAKRNEMTYSQSIELFLSATHNLWLVCKPYIARKEQAKVKEIDNEINVVYGYLSSITQTAKKYTGEMALFQMNFCLYWKRLMDLNAKIEQLLMDCDVLGGMNGKSEQ